MTLFDTLNDEIRVFVDRHPRLRSGTGEYSSPFRGILFGTNDAAEVAARLADTPVDVLWLGSNPNVPSSVANILHGTGDDFHRFEAHVGAGLYAPGPVGGQKAAWDPARVGGGWAVYRAMFPRLDRVAFANVIPWGSSVASAFLGPLKDADAALHAEIVAFSLMLNARIVDALRPRLVLVPFSVARSPSFAGTRFAPDLGDEVHIVSGTRFRYAVRRSTIPVLFAPHASALRLSAEGRPLVKDELARVVREFVGVPA